MTVAHKISALLEGLTMSDVQAMAPAERERFAALCCHWWRLAEPPAHHPADGRQHRESGVLKDLRQGHRQE
jgi:hypothetical protein